MPNALTFIIGADSTPYQREMRTIEAMTATSAKRINAAMGGGHVGGAGVFRELIVVAREIAMGRGIARIAGSFTLLAQYLSSATSGVKAAGAAAAIAAEEYERLALSTSLAAKQSLLKAQASEAAFMAEGGETEETLAAATADRQKATADIQVAAASRAKANASAAAAEAAEAEAAATAPKGPGLLAGLIVNPVTGVIVGLLVGMMAAYKLAGALKERLAGIKFPEFHAEYIPKHLQAVNQIAEGWKKIGEAVDKALSKYNSAAETAQRLASLTADQFGHEKRMLALAKEREMAGAKTKEDKAAVERKYDAADLDLLRRQQGTEEDQKTNEANNLDAEAKAKMAKAGSILVPSKERDQNDARNMREKAEAAQKYLDDLAKARLEGPGAAEHVVRAYNAVSLSGVKNSDLDAATAANEKEARQRIAAANNFADTEHEHDEARRKKEDLIHDAEASAAKAAEITAGRPDRAKKYQQDYDEARAEAEAKDAAEAASHEKKSILKGSANAAQAIGFSYIAPGTSQMIDIARASERHLANIDRKLGARGTGGEENKFGGVKH